MGLTMTEPKSLNDERHPLSNIDRIIHAPARLMVMTYLYVVERADYTFLMRLTGLTWGNLSSHLSKLESAGYVEMEKKFVDKKPYTMVGLTKLGRQSFIEYKDLMQGVLEDLPLAQGIKFGD